MRTRALLSHAPTFPALGIALRLLAWLLVGPAAGCGREPSPCRVELFVCSGFCPGSSGSASGDDPCYLRNDVGLEVSAACTKAGHEVVEHDVSDSEEGYATLVRQLREVNRDAGAGGTRTVVVAHSHGCVWAHAATRAVPEVPIDLLVDLDATSFGWAFVTTPSIGDPRDGVKGPDGTTSLDLEDVVFPNVRENLEVRSGEHAVYGLAPELYDEQANVAISGASRITTWDVGTSHSEVHEASGTTLPRVAAWIVSRLAPP